MKYIPIYLGVILFLFLWYDGLRSVLSSSDLSESAQYIVSTLSIFLAYLIFTLFFAFAVKATISVFDWFPSRSFRENLFCQFSKYGSIGLRLFRLALLIMMIIYFFFAAQVMFDVGKALLNHKFTVVEGQVTRVGSTQGRKSPGHRYLEINGENKRYILCSVCSANVDDEVELVVLPETAFALDIKHTSKSLFLDVPKY